MLFSVGKTTESPKSTIKKDILNMLSDVNMYIHNLRKVIQKILSNHILRKKYQVQARYYKSVLGPMLKGMACSSVRIHKYSPSTVISTVQITLVSHQEAECGNMPLNIQQMMR